MTKSYSTQQVITEDGKEFTVKIEERNKESNRAFLMFYDYWRTYCNYEQCTPIENELRTLMLQKMNYDNKLYSFTVKTLYEDYGIKVDKKTFSNFIKKCKQRDFIRPRSERGNYMINPCVVFKGSAENRRRLRSEYIKLPINEDDTFICPELRNREDINFRPYLHEKQLEYILKNYPDPKIQSKLGWMSLCIYWSRTK